MSLNEKARLTIPGPMAYGDQGFPGLIPKNATLLFDVTLKKIN
jgi:FK506-binding protein 1